MNLNKLQSIQENIEHGIIPAMRIIDEVKRTSILGDSPTWAYALGILLKLDGYESFVEEQLKSRIENSRISSIDALIVSEYLDLALRKMNNKFLILWMSRLLDSPCDQLCQINISATIGENAKLGKSWAITLRDKYKLSHSTQMVRENLNISGNI